MTTCYASADIAVVHGTPYWAIHALDDNGDKTSWLVHGLFDGNGFSIRLDVWIPGALQAIAGDGAGYLWGMTADGELVTNAPMEGRPAWFALAPHPGLPDRPVWYLHRLVFVSNGQESAELGVCMLWVSDELLVGTFSRRIYCWDGETARLEYDGKAPELSGGINDLVQTCDGVFALGYGGTLVQRGGDRTWSQLTAPWSPDDAPYINIVAGTEGADGRLRAVVDDGWVLAATGGSATATHKLAAKPLGIVTFHEQLYVATLDGCYELLGAGDINLVKRGIAMGKAVCTDQSLFAVDAAPDDPDRAGLHIWTRTREADQWATRTIG